MKSKSLHIIAFKVVFVLAWLTVFGLLVFPLFIQAQTVCTYSATPGNLDKVNGQGGSWNQPQNTSTSNDAWTRTNNNALDNVNDITDYVYVSQFNFVLPTYATITGYSAIVERHQDFNNCFTVRDNDFTLTKDGDMTPDSQNKASGVDWTLSDMTYDYGGANDLWGAAFTRAQIMTPAFGFLFNVKNASAAGCNRSGRAYLDYIQVTIHYTVPPGQTCQSPLSAGISNFNYIRLANGAIKLNWTSTIDNTSDVFVIERRGSDGTFQELGNISVKQNGSSYSFVDNSPLNEVSLYRIKELGTNGAVQATGLLNVRPESNVSEELKLTVYPNPSVIGSTTKVTINGATPFSNLEIELIDQTGAVVKKQTLLTDAAANASLTMSEIDSKLSANSLYFIKVSDPFTQKTATKKLMLLASK